MKPDELKSIRASLGLSQRALAAAIGVTVGTVSVWERGQYEIPQASSLAIRMIAEERKNDAIG